MPRRAHEPTAATRKQVEAMIAYGVPEADVARVVGIHDSTLRKYYRTEIDTAHAKANARVAEALFQQAMKGNVTAQIFWLKTRARWREDSQAPVQPVTYIVRSTDDQGSVHEDRARRHG
jgi:hypothetical protein